jgi:hypothetical protein
MSMMLRAGPMTVTIALGIVSLAASAEKMKEPDDPIVIPEAAVAVDQVRLLGKQSWKPLNRRMLLVNLGTKPYLFIFDAGCSRLMQPGAIIQTRSETTLYAKSDVIYVSTRRGGVNGTADALFESTADAITAGAASCQIERMYSILPEDVPVLKKQLKALKEEGR